MAGVDKIREALQDKLQVKRAQLYNIAKDIADQLSISTGDAILVLAVKNHINLHKHGSVLPPGKLEQIRGMIPYVQTTVAAAAQPAAKAKTGTKKPKKPFRVKLDNPEADPILNKGTRDEIEAMVPVYQTLSLLENSIRQFLTRVLKAKHGNNWWEKIAPNGLQKHVTTRLADDEVNAWHQRRSTNPIDYLDLNQLPALVRAAQTDFVDAFFPTAEWFQHFITEVYRSRCVVCHMNPLNDTNTQDVAVRFNQWEQLIKAKIAEVTRLENPQAVAAVEVTPAAPAQ